MDSRNFCLTLLTVALFAAPATAASVSHNGANGWSATTTTTTLSADDKKDEKDKKKRKPGVQQHKNVPQKQNTQHKPQFQQKKNTQQKQQFQKKQNVQQKQQFQKKQNVQQKPQFQQKQNVQQKQQIQQKKFTGSPKKFTPKHNHVVQQFKLKNASKAFVHGQNYSVYRQSYRRRHNGAWRTFVALGVLAPLLIGADEYYPYAYVDVPGDYCEGLTEDGCELVYDEVETLEGDVIPQCVAYCPWQ